MEGKKRFAFKVPDALVLIVILLVVASLATYLLPTGSYERVVDPVSGVTVADPSTYHQVENNPVSLWGVLQSIPKGLNESAEIINFLLIIGGAFGVLKGTGALDALLQIAIVKLKGRERLVIPFILTFWAVGGAVLGNFEECLAFLPIQITLCLALGFDSITGVALGMCGVAIGYIGAILNPFTIATAQKIADVPLFSGMGLRLAVFLVLLVATILYVYIYAGKIQKDPTKSLVYQEDLKSKYREDNLLREKIDFTNRHKLSMVAFTIGIVILVYGVVEHGFYLPEIGAVFIGVSIVVGLIGNLGVNGTVDMFVKGATNLLYACLCVGFARAITVVMVEGNILDVVVHGLSSFIMGLPLQVSAVGMFFFQGFINMFIPSGTGQAVVSMPIMTPLADVIGLTRQTAVLAFQFGDGITNLVTPTAGDLMAALAIGGIAWPKWIKWFGKLLIIWIIICCAFLMLATAIGYGPV